MRWDSSIAASIDYFPAAALNAASQTRLAKRTLNAETATKIRLPIPVCMDYFWVQIAILNAINGEAIFTRAKTVSAVRSSSKCVPLQNGMMKLG
jgi:hypothetical protein